MTMPPDPTPAPPAPGPDGAAAAATGPARRLRSGLSTALLWTSMGLLVAMTLLVGIVGQVIQNLADLGVDPPIWVSGNLDRGDEINAEHIRKYRGKVDIL